jgi:beta-lactamase class A
LADLEEDLVEISGRFAGLTGFYVQDLTTGQEIGHSTHVTTSGMSMIKVAVMATAYRAITRPFELEMQDALSDMIAHSINEQSNAVILQVGGGDFQAGMQRVNETLHALGMHQSYIRGPFRTEGGPEYELIEVPERPPVAVPRAEQIDVLPDTAMQTSLADQALFFEALYHCTLGTGRLLEAYPELSPEDCHEMLDLLQTNPTRTLLGAGFPDEVPMAHKHGFGGGVSTDERMNVGIVWPPEGRPFLVGLYQWDDVDWIHWLRVWPMQIEFSTTVYNFFATPPPRPAPSAPPVPP